MDGVSGVFADLVGQDQAVGVLRRAAAAAADAIAGGRGAGMTHAWLFTGPPGSGRSNAARAFAAALLCNAAPGPGRDSLPGPDSPPGADFTLGVGSPSAVEPGCGRCGACHQVRVGSHPDLTQVRPEGLSYSVRQTRDLVLKAAGAPTLGRWRIVLFEDADRVTEAAANALLKAIEEPPPRTVWLLCAPSPDDMIITIRSRCRVVTLRTPSTEAVARVLAERDGVPSEMALFAARAAQGHIGRARRLALDEEVRRRRADVLSIPSSISGVGDCIAAAERLVKTSTEAADAATAELNETETAELRKVYGEGSSGKGLNKGLIRGGAGALKELETLQKSRATRIKRDSLDLALLDLVAFYRDVLAVQFGSGVELTNEDRRHEVEALARGSSPEDTLRRTRAIMKCRDRIAANVNPQIAVEAMTLALRSPGAV